MIHAMLVLSTRENVQNLVGEFDTYGDAYAWAITKVVDAGHKILSATNAPTRGGGSCLTFWRANDTGAAARLFHNE